MAEHAGMGQWFTGDDMDQLGGFIQTQLDVDPTIGPRVENLIRSYPTVSRDVVAGLAASGQLNVDSTLLEEIAERDVAAQQAAKANWGWRGLKTGTRYAGLYLEDLYNNTMFQTVPRLSINLYQGRSLNEAIDTSFGTALGTEITMRRAGFNIDYGQGFFASEEYIPQDDKYWQNIKELVLSGRFDGSPEEVIIAARQQAQRDQALATGMNPYAIQRNEWQSTLMYSMVNGKEVAVPYSPGTGFAIQFAKPGSRAYDGLSAFVDGGFRLAMEPGDFFLDNLGTGIRKFTNPAVTGAVASFTSRGSAIMREVLNDFAGIRYIDDPVMVLTGRYDEFTGEPLEAAVKGVTDPDGSIGIDVDAIERQWLGREANKGQKEWLDPTDPYVVPHVEAGRSPEDVRLALAERGGVDAEVLLTIEHELVHNQVQGKWFDIRELDDGTAVILTEAANSKAPQELQDIARQMIDEGVTQDEIIRLAEQLEGMADDIDVLQRVATDRRKTLNMGIKNKQARVNAQKSVKRAFDELEDAKKLRGERQAAITSKSARKLELDKARRAFTESHAVKTAWDNMLNGKWAAKKLMSAYKRKAGLSKIMRPFVSPMAMQDYATKGIAKRTFRRLAETTNIEQLRRFAPWANGQELNKLSDMTEPGDIAELMKKAFEGKPGTQQPTIGILRDKFTAGLDSWEATHRFLGGTIAGSIRKQGRRWVAGTGNNVISSTDLNQTLDTIYNTLITAGVDPERVSNLQKYAINNYTSSEGINEIQRSVNKMLSEAIGKRGKGNLYDKDVIQRMFDEFAGYEKENRIYQASSAGKERPVIFESGKYRAAGPLDEVTSEAAMEAQFATTSRVVPDVRRIRRLTSRRRTVLERYRKGVAEASENPDKVWTPLGFETTSAMHAGDFGFGIWRDMQLLRGGWAARVIPEESLRFSGSGYSGMFNNPLDYLITVFNNVDYKLVGDELTIADMLRQTETLGAAQLQDTLAPVHKVKGSGWRIAYRARESDVASYWGGMSRNVITMSHDRITSIVAKKGRAEAERYLLSTEGRKILKEVSTKAKKGSSLEAIPTTSELVKYLDVTELKLVQMTGGEGIWFDPVSKKWMDLYDNVVDSVTDRNVFANKDALRRELAKLGADQPLTRATRLDLETAVNTARGYDIDELVKDGRAAFITTDGNSEMRKLFSEKALDDISLSEDLPFDRIRQIDKQLEQAYDRYGVEPPAAIPVSDSEMLRNDPSTYKKVTDKLFYWLNSVPSRKLNRQPFFQQAFGNKLAQIYYFGDTDMRNALDAVLASDRGLQNAFDVGRRKMYRDFGVSKMGKPFNKWTREPDEISYRRKYADAIVAGSYDQIPLEGGGFITPQFQEWMSEQGNLTVTGANNRGQYAYRHGRYETEGKIRSVEDVTFHGSNSLAPVSDTPNPYSDELFAKSDELEQLREQYRFFEEEDRDMFAAGNVEMAIEEAEAEYATLWDLHSDHEELTGGAQRVSDLGAGGMAISIDRAASYARSAEARFGGSSQRWVSAFYTPHQPSGLKAQIDEFGDIEQIYSIERDFPQLADIPDMADRFPQFRKDYLQGVDEWQKTADALHVELVAALDEAGITMRPDGTWTISDSALMKVDDPFDTRTTEEIIESVLVDMPEVTDAFPNMWQIGRFIEDPTFAAKPAGILKTSAIPKLEEAIGRTLTDIETETLSLLSLSRGGAEKLEEIFLIDDKVRPMLQVPLDIMMSMMDEGFMATSNRAIGDAAQFIEANMVPVSNNIVTEALEYPVRSQARKTRTPSGVWPDAADSPLTSGKRLVEDMMKGESRTAYDLDGTRAAMQKKVRPNDRVHGTTNADGSLELNQDYGLYVESPRFRQYVQEVEDWGIDLKTRILADGNVDTFGALLKMPDEALVDELIEFVDASELAYRGEFAFESRAVDPYNVGGIGPESAGRQEYENTITSFQNQVIDDVYGGDDFLMLADFQRLAENEMNRAANINRQYTFFNKDYDYSSKVSQISDSPFKNYNWKPEMTELKTNFNGVPQPERNASTGRVFGETYGRDFDLAETSNIAANPSVPTDTRKDLEALMQAAKYDSIDETKDLFYDLSSKSNIADSLKFVFPFGDAWYEVLSRWATIMNPTKQGAQSLRNVRRGQVSAQAAKQSGFISTNEYGEESFNVPISPGSLMNLFIPNSSNVNMAGNMAVSSLMFIDPTSRSISGPGVGPIVQATVGLTAPIIDQIPVFRDLARYFTYGSKDAYQPGSFTGSEDIIDIFANTVTRRIFGAVFAEDQKETIGNTKLTLFESLMASGDPSYDPFTPGGSTRAWDVANTAGTSLAFLKILDSWFMPGQPQYLPQFKAPELPDGAMSYEEVLDAMGELTGEQQAPLVSVLRLREEYRQVRDLFGDAEGGMYMAERYGLYPPVLQSTSQALVQRPVTWGGVRWVDDNKWLNDVAPLTLAWTVPPDADDTFSSAAWNNQFSDILQVEGIDNDVVRRRRTPSEIDQVIKRSAGYDQLNYQQQQYDKAVSALRARYGDKYSSNSEYRIAKKRVDQIFASNKSIIYTQFPSIRGENQGAIVGQQKGLTTRNLVSEIINIGSAGTTANRIFRKELPELADVAEFYSQQFQQLEIFSLKQDENKAQAGWWLNAESDTAVAVRKEFARRSQEFFGSLSGDAREYAKNIQTYLLDVLLDDWEWIDKGWAPEVKTYPSIQRKQVIRTP